MCSNLSLYWWCSQVIRSLKRALQPSVTDVEVNFQVTSGFKAFQAPAKIPTIFKGDKIVAYGIFKTKATSDASLEAGLTGTATLQGQILDSPMTHSITFEVPPPPTAGEKEGGSLTGFEIPVVHHLAAKSLLSDWSNGLGWSATAPTDERKQEMIKLSIESSVVSEHTAFVAYDVDQSQPIKGAMQVWDLTTSMAEQSVYHQLCARGGGYGIGSKRERSRGVASRHHSVQPKKKKLTKKKAAAKKKASSTMKSSSTVRERGPSSYKADALSLLISLQQAAGYWSLKAVADKIIKKKGAMDPPQGVTAEVWATILALVFLEVRCAAQKDEWELIAMKAEAWLATQTVSVISFASLREKAKEQL